MKMVCLANSRKNKTHCVAGIDLETGRWIRPISTVAHGELDASQVMVASGSTSRQIAPLDIVQIGDVVSSPQIGQPENVLRGDTKWTLIRMAKVTEVLNFVESSGPLFYGTSHQISEVLVTSARIEKSLMLIRVEAPTFFERTYKRQLRVRFKFGGNNYELPVTDNSKWVKDAKLSPEQFNSGSWLFTVSLGESWQGNRYKLIACGMRITDEDLEDEDEDDYKESVTTTSPIVSEPIDLLQQIAAELSLRSPQSCRELAKALRTSKTEINPLLYEHSELFMRQGDNPPFWSARKLT